ncbi:hypothetical protein [Streptomyces sp. WAC 06725]|nr:hypothetical protein [Streptomyces sp. WAC 06725]
MATDQTEDHYEECPAAGNPDGPCYCEGINASDEAYWAEPPDMAAQESRG